MNETVPLRKRIIVALDVKKKDDAFHLIEQLKQADIFKVGLSLFISEGPSLLKKIKVFRKKILLDLKLHDIPNTVAQAVKSGMTHGIHMMTLHASGGREMLKRASEAAEEEAAKKGTAKPLLLAVTVLTSLRNDELKDLGIDEDVTSRVLRLAEMAKETGMNGVVCSPQEVETVKKRLGKGFLTVVPGIRPSWAPRHDQKRTMTPSLALRKGADFLVVGRPILEAPAPQKAFVKILEELNRSVDCPYGKNCS